MKPTKAETLEGAFINAALGMIDYMVPLERIDCSRELIIEASSTAENTIHGALIACYNHFKVFSSNQIRLGKLYSSSLEKIICTSDIYHNLFFFFCKSDFFL